MHLPRIIVILLLPFIASAQQPLGLCLENYAYPYPVKYISLHLQHEEIKMAYMDVRPDQPNGHTILLLHGKNFCGAYWGPTAKALAAKGYRLIIPDQVGFGKSSKPEHLQYTFQLLAQNTKAVLDSAQVGKVIVLGHSALTSDMIFTQPVCYEFDQIKAPSLLLIGQLDRTAPGKDRTPDSIRQTLGDYPALGKLTQKKIPNCQLVPIPGVGHVPHMEAFDTFMTSLLNFLAK